MAGATQKEIDALLKDYREDEYTPRLFLSQPQVLALQLVSGPQGIGVQLPETETCRELKKRVEGLLAGALQSSRPTHTI